MRSARRPEKVKLIVGLISNDAALLSGMGRVLERALRNKIDFESPLLDFVHTDYYAYELGDGLKRKFLSFAKNVPLEGLEKVKLVTNRLEKRYSGRGKRSVNIDPGYIDLAKVVLFSTKDYVHRIHAGRGIFAEVTLYYKDRSFNEWPWTYPDYRTAEYKTIFSAMRELYKKDKDA